MENSILKDRLLEEVNRYKRINSYLINEQAAPPAAPLEDPNAPPAGAELPPAPTTGATPTNTTTPPAEEPTPPADVEPEADDSTEEIDITDLVNMTKSIKQDLESTKTDDTGVTQKMDDVFSKLSELEAKLGEMDNIIAKIDQLGAHIDEMKPPTPVEKLEMRSLDSYPFNQKPDQFFSQKQGEMKASGKNEYILTKDDVENYSKDEITKSFNPDDDEWNKSEY